MNIPNSKFCLIDKELDDKHTEFNESRGLHGGRIRYNLVDSINLVEKIQQAKEKLREHDIILFNHRFNDDYIEILVSFPCVNDAYIISSTLKIVSELILNTVLKDKS